MIVINTDLKHKSQLPFTHKVTDLNVGLFNYKYNHPVESRCCIWSHRLQVKIGINNSDMFHKYYWADFQLLQELSSDQRSVQQMTVLQL